MAPPVNSNEIVFKFMLEALSPSTAEPAVFEAYGGRHVTGSEIIRADLTLTTTGRSTKNNVGPEPARTARNR
jgi:hypothetical protein